MTLKKPNLKKIGITVHFPEFFLHIPAVLEMNAP